MAIPPPRVSDFPDEPDETPLERNQFSFGGYSVQYLRPFKVFDDKSNTSCRISVECDLTRHVAPEWADTLDEAPPGSIQDTGSVTITFAPAVSGRIYRVETSSGSQRKRYVGPDVAANALPKPTNKAVVSIKQFFDEISIVRFVIVVTIVLLVLAGAGYAVYRTVR